MDTARRFQHWASTLKGGDLFHLNNRGAHYAVRILRTNPAGFLTVQNIVGAEQFEVFYLDLERLTEMEALAYASQ
jgi:hypothetical protein